MNDIIHVKNFPAPVVSVREILRYCGSKSDDESTVFEVGKCLVECEKLLEFKVCYTVLPVNIDNDVCDFGVFSAESKNLAKNLSSCREVVIFAATVGVRIDRLIAKYGRISPVKSLIFQGIGAERVEALCDEFCRDFEEENKVKLRPRFSPGYGDLSLELQRDIFSLLDCSRKIGVSLNDSLLMSPSKSVTAIAGISNL